MRTWALLPAILVLASILSGCTGGNKAAPAGSSSDPGGETGLVTGTVTDEEFFPLEGAKVALRAASFSPLALSASTDTEGRYRIEKVPPGSKVLVATREGFIESETKITVVAGEENAFDFQLVRLPSTTPRISPQTAITGGYDCAAEWGIGGGSCDGALPPEAPHPLASASDHNFTVASGWGGLLLELDWTVGGGGELLEGMRFEVLAENGTTRLAYVEGTGTPLRVVLDRGVPHAASADNATLGAEGGKVLLRARPIGLLDEGTCAAQCADGFGAGLDLKYDIWPTIFFGGHVEPDYSALEEGQ